MGDRVVIDDLVPRRQDEHLLIVPHTLALSDEDLDVGEGFRGGVILRAVAQGESGVLLLEGGGHFDGEPVSSGVREEVEVAEGGAVLLAEVDGEVEGGREGDYLGVGLGVGHLSGQL